MKKTLLSCIPIVFSLLFLSIYNIINGKPLTGSDSALPDPYGFLIIPIIFGGLSLPVIVSFIETRQRQKKTKTFSEKNQKEQKATVHLSNDLKKYYDILGINEYATSSEIKTAYRDWIKFYHPDKFETKSREDQSVAREKSKEIISAYEELKNAGKVN